MGMVLGGSGCCIQTPHLFKTEQFLFEVGKNYGEISQNFFVDCTSTAINLKNLSLLKIEIEIRDFE